MISSIIMYKIKSLYLAVQIRWIHSMITLLYAIVPLIVIHWVDKVDEFFVAYIEMTFSAVNGHILISIILCSVGRAIRFTNINYFTIRIDDTHFLQQNIGIDIEKFACKSLFSSILLNSTWFVTFLYRGPNWQKYCAIDFIEIFIKGVLSEPSIDPINVELYLSRLFSKLTQVIERIFFEK